MLSKHVLFLCRAACVAALFFLIGCGSGDDDGRRLGEQIVGTWQRGWGEGDVVINSIESHHGDVPTTVLCSMMTAPIMGWCGKALSFRQIRMAISF